MAAKIKPQIVERMRALMEIHDSPERRADYRAGRFPRSNTVNDLDVRYRWDLYWFSEAFKALPKDHDFDDRHIDTALRSIVPPLGEA